MKNPWRRRPVEFFDEDDCSCCPEPPARKPPEPLPPIDTLTGLAKARRAVELSRGDHAVPTRAIVFTCGTDREEASDD